MKIISIVLAICTIICVLVPPNQNYNKFKIDSILNYIDNRQTVNPFPELSNQDGFSYITDKNLSSIKKIENLFTDFWFFSIYPAKLVKWCISELFAFVSYFFSQNYRGGAHGNGVIQGR